MEKAIKNKSKSIKKRSFRTLEKGFSLVEFLIGSTITLGAITLSFSLLDQGQSAINMQRSKATAQARARKALNLLTADIRATGSSPGNFYQGLAPGLYYASANQIQMISDRNGNGTTNVLGDEDANDNITYTYSSTNKTLTRYAPNDPAYTNSGVVLTNELESLTIKFYDKDGAELTPPSSGTMDKETRDRVTRMNIIVTINIIEKGKVTGTVTLDNPVAIRNYITDGYY